MTTLEDRIRDLAKRGELTHVSLAPTLNGKGWKAAYSPSSVFGNSIAEHADPVQAILAAFDGIKLKRRAATNMKPTPEPTPEEAYDPAA